MFCEFFGTIFRILDNADIFNIPFIGPILGSLADRFYLDVLGCEY